MANKDIEAILPLSPLQQGLLFHALRDRDEDPYFIQAGFALEGELDAAAFARAFASVARRHAILRSAFVWEKVEKPVQVVRSEATVPLSEHDLRGLDPRAQQGAAAEILRADRREGFALNKAPLMRLTLIRVADKTTHVYNSHHHLILDGWSFAVVLREVLLTYRALVRGEQPSLPPAASYRDYLSWVGRRDREQAESFFRAALAGFHAATPLPLAASTPRRIDAHPELPFAEQEHAFSREQTAALEAFARKQRVTLNTAVQGAFALLLARHAGQREVLFGTTVSGRPPELQGAESMVGVLINTLPVRVAVDGAMLLGAYLRALQAHNAELRSYEWMPLAEVRRTAEVASGAPLFESIVVFDSYPEEDVAPGELEVRTLPRGEQREGGALLTAGRNNFPLSLMVEPNAQLKLICAYARSRLSHDAAASLLAQLATLLSEMVRNPDAQLATLSMLSERERAALLSAVETDAPASAATAHALFEAHAARTPGAPALYFEGETLSYGELDRRANAVARRLGELGLGCDDRVGLCVERSMAMVVGLLGALKAGAAYVPLDPKFPEQRRSEILRDSGARALLTTRALARSAAPDIAVVELDGRERADAAFPRVPARAESAAYLIYTSGSTGRPKGVVVEHRQLVRYVEGVAARLPLADVRSFALVSTVAADLGHTSLFGALCTGRALHLVPTELAFDPDGFAASMAEAQVDALKIVPSHLAALLEAAEPGRALPRRALVIGGEAASASLLRRVRELAPACAVINHYGPTEATVGALTHQLDDASPTPLPLGRPLPHVRAYVLGRDLELSPVGAEGELYLAGLGVARGYHERPALTAERFLPDPFATTPGARLYRTGDRARLRADGQFEFLGRLDHQLKVRGNRVELGEIEARLARQPGVREALVLARGESGATRLVGYVVGARELDLAAIEAELACALPDYMVPSALVRLDALPLTANGKIDRAALPDEAAPARSTPEFVAPRDEIEAALDEVWRGVLGVEQLSVHDNFFARGGDSIRTLQVIARANQRGIKLSPKQLFQHPTIAGIAALARSRSASAAAPAPAPQHEELRPFALTGLDDAALARALPDLAALEDAYPLSPMQEGMLFHTRLAPKSGIYLMQHQYAWNGALDLARVAEAWRLVAERHPMLRTAFVWEGLERPLQCVYRRVDMRDVVLHVDLRGLDGAAQEARIRATLDAELAEGLDMKRAPLMRVRLFQLADEAYHIVRSFHHILTDGWCFSVLMMECLRYYAALAEGRSLSLPTPRPYRDYIAWLAQRDARAAETFYREELRGFSAPTPLGIERTHPDAAHAGVGDVFFELEPSVSDALMAHAQEHKLTPNTFVQGAWAVLLSRYAQTRDVLFGVTVAGRPTDLPGVENIVGLFINSLPLRVEVDPARPLLPWLRDLLARNYRLREHEHAPLVSIQQWSELPHGEPLFKSLIVFENIPQDPQLGEQVREVEVSFDGDRVHTNYPLTVVAYPGPRLGVRISFDKRLCAADDVQRMLGSLRTLLEQMVARPSARLGELAMLSEEERTRALGAPTPPSRGELTRSDYVSLFEAQVRRTPDAVAVRSGARELSYDALNRAANRVAHALRAEGVEADCVVAVLERRDLELLVAVLGVLKAGGAYLPLDPAHPSERIAEILRDSRAQVLLTSRALEPLARSAAGGARVLLREHLAPRAGDRDNLGIPCNPRALAYVIFTSGSTGRPKGAMVEHAGMLNNVHGKLPALELGAGDVVAQTASQCFDISVWQLLSGLLAGARVQIIEDEVVRDPRALLDVIDAQGVSILELVPSLLRELVHEAEQRREALLRVRWVLPTGEALTPELCRRWFARFPRIPLLNAYGPAECADDVALHRIVAAPPDNVVHMPIGRPVPNVNLYVASGEELAPLGVAGELCVAGIGVGRGYVGRPARTAEVFVPDPFSKVPGARMYRTGDLARRASDGTLVFLGRRDHQVKVRGHRIELGEIEARLAAVSGVAQAAVAVRDDRGRGAELVAYLVRERACELDADAVRSALAAKLPAAMLPSAYVWLEALPLNGNGKVDRARLPAPEVEDEQGEQPESETERRLAAIYGEVLGLANVGRRSHFFLLGGHSLLATRVVSRVRERCAVDLPLRSVFDAPVLCDLAQEIDSAPRLTGELVPLAPVPRSGPLPLSYAQRRLWFLSQIERDPAAYNMSAAVKVEGALNAAALRRAWQALSARHEALRTVFVTVDGEPMQRAAELTPAFAMEDLSMLTEPAREAALQRAAQAHVEQPFDLERGPLARLLHVQLAREEHALVLALHHIVADGWSLNVLVRDLAELYAAEVARRPSALPPQPIQYADYAVWQRRWMEGVREAQLAHWKERLAGAPELDLRPDRARGAGDSLRVSSARHVQELDPMLLASLRAASDGGTLFMRLLAAYKVVLARRSGQSDVLVGTDVANRRRAETEAVVGFFVNLLALRTSLADDPSLRELIERVRATTLDAYAHQDLPFEEVIDAVRPARVEGRHPLVQTLFVLQNTPSSELELEGVRFRPLELEQEASRFDLGVFAEELEDGLLVTWKYRSDLFEPSTIAALAAEFERTLRALVADPSQRLSALAAAEKRARSEQQRAKLRSLRGAAQKKERSLVSTRLLDPQGLPLLLEPGDAEIELAAWARSDRASLEALLRRHGALLFRGFGLRSVGDFESVAEAVCGELFGEYGDLPREKSGRQVYSSTPYPEDESILFHNESSHLPRWPRKQWFFCVQPSLEGGATPIVDCRRVLAALPPEIVEHFARLGLHYVRNFVPGFDVRWQDFFHTDDPAAVDARCAREGMSATWLDGGRLRIGQRGPGVLVHPQTGERSFFNQVQLHHPDYLSERVRSSLLALVGEDGLPRNVTYGDGSPIDLATTAAIGEAYERCAVRFPWQAGDLLLLDNMLVAHARDPFRGARKIVVAMGEMQERAALEVQP